MSENSLHFWIIPIIALVMGVAVLGYVLDQKINVIIPNSIVERDELNSMDCPQIKSRHAIGSYWTPSNGEFAREKVKSCLDAEAAYKSNLKEILKTGTHQEKLDAEFTKLWFGVYDHPDLSFLRVQTPPMIAIVHGNEHGISNFVPKDTMVIMDFIINSNKNGISLAGMLCAGCLAFS